MRKALLLYNPESGRRRQRRVEQVGAAAAALGASGVETVVEVTREPGSAAAQVRAAIEAGCDAVIVCGGDGSVHEALPGIVGTPAALGVIPLGTGNGLANDLGLPRDPAAAARLLAAARPRAITLPRIEYPVTSSERRSNHFMIGAGVGADAQMVYALTLRIKQRWGMAAYYTESTRQWLTNSFPLFNVEFRDEQGRQRSEQVSQLLAIRITWFGGLLRRLAPGAALERDDFTLVLFKTRRRMRYLQYMIGVWQDRGGPVPDVEIVHSREVRCLPLEATDRQPAHRIYAEADGELLGMLPVSLSMTAETVDLLVPSTAFRR